MQAHTPLISCVSSAGFLHVGLGSVTEWLIGDLIKHKWVTLHDSGHPRRRFFFPKIWNGHYHLFFLSFRLSPHTAQSVERGAIGSLTPFWPTVNRWSDQKMNTFLVIWCSNYSKGHSVGLSSSNFSVKVKSRRWGQFKANRCSDQKINIFWKFWAKITLDDIVWACLV